MNRRFAAFSLAFVLLLTGCASLLNRDYSSVTPHSTTPTAEEDSSLRVESYQELVNAILYLVTQGADEGRIRLYNYPQSQVEEDLAAACLEVVQEDPLGAYSVDFITFDVSTIVSYYEAAINISYRRSQEQVAAIVMATGASAIRSELRRMLSEFDTEMVLRISYFDGNEDDIETLLRQAHSLTPETALDLPDWEITLYPQTGTRRIVEVILTYQQDPETLQARKNVLAQRTQQLLTGLLPGQGEEAYLELGRLILDQTTPNAPGGSTAYHALVEGGADSQGLALALALLCQQLDLSCQVVGGEVDGLPHFWNIVNTPAGYRHFDVSRLAILSENEDPQAPEEPIFFSDRWATEQGYLWNTGTTPLCGAQPEEKDGITMSSFDIGLSER